jgi:HKD family nuclease
MLISIVSQPDDSRFGDQLNSLLSQSSFKNFIASVAFVTSSGAQSLQSQVEAFLKRGGKARFIVGVSRRVTTVEGLQVLLELVSKGADVRVFHNENPAVIFHPKGYLLEGPNKVVLIVGSNNITGKGLYENYELSVACEFDPNDKDDAATIKAAKDVFDRFAVTTDGLCKILTVQLLDELNDAGYLGSEAKRTNAPESSGEGENADPTLPKKKLFGSKTVKGAPKFVKNAPVGSGSGVEGGNARAVPPKPIQALIKAPTGTMALGPLVWEKQLSATDAQRSTGTTNPVGGVRLTQAKYKVNGRVIDQTKYFRNNVFGANSWKTKKQKPFEENTFIDAEVIIKGESQGSMKLEVSHKQSGEAGQGNYTTQIHWGSLNGIIKASQLAGQRLRLYTPAKGNNQYTIEIG